MTSSSSSTSDSRSPPTTKEFPNEDTPLTNSSLRYDPRPSLKRKLMPTDHITSKFVRTQLSRGTRLPNVHSPNTRVLEFGGPIFGFSHTPEAILVRDCYVKMRDSILEVFEKDTHPGILVAGTHGVGKSVFGLLMVLELCARGKFVVYEHYPTRTMIVPETGLPPSPRTTLDRLDFDVSTITPGFYDLSHDVNLAQQLVDKEGTCVVQDLGGEMSTMTVSPAGKWLVLSSPNAEKLRPLSTVMRKKVLVMPLWSLEELQAARRDVYERLPKTIFAGYSVEEANQRFERYGGVPRLVLERPREAESFMDCAETALGTALCETSIEELTTIFSQVEYYSVPKLKAASILVHLVEDDGGRLRLKIATDYVARRLIDQQINRVDFNVKSFLRAARHVRELAAFRRYALEQIAHRDLQEGDRMGMIELEATREASRKTQREVYWPSLAPLSSFSANDAGDLQALACYQYVRPENKIFPTLDSFAVMPLSVFKQDETGDCLAVFQVAISTPHVVRSTPLIQVLRKVRDLVKESLPLVLVFVTDRDGIATSQTITTDAGDVYRGKELGEVLQVGLYLGEDFNELARYCRAKMTST